MKKFLLLAAFLLALGGLASHTAYAQGPVIGGPAPDPTPTPDPAAVPPDGGASLLAASGIAYGIRYLRQRRKQA